MTLGIAIAALLAGGVVNAGAANAAASDCPARYGCYWAKPNYAGTMGIFAVDVPDCLAHPGPSTACIRSVANHGTRCTLYLWTGPDYTGRVHSLARGDEVADVTAPPPVGYGEREIRSAHWCTQR